MPSRGWPSSSSSGTIGGLASKKRPVMAAPGFEDVVVGIAGTGSMGRAHASRWSQEGLKVVIGSRDPARAQRLAGQCRGDVEGTSHAEMLKKANFIILATPPGQALADFFDAHKDIIRGAGKCFVDLSVAFSRYGSPAVQPPPPYLSTIEWLKDRFDDPSTCFVKAWANLMAASIVQNRKQPVEVAGDDKAKEIAFRMLTKVGFTPCDCGGVADVPKIEPGFHERR